MPVTEAITTLTAIGALVFTGLSLNSTRDQVAAVQQQNRVAEQAQFTERYARAVEQLDRTGPEHLQGRLGAIYALERLASDSPRDQPTIIEILSAFVRTSRPAGTANRLGTVVVCPAAQAVSPDAHAALTVLGRRHHSHDDNAYIDLKQACLNGTDLSQVRLRGADLMTANLNGANLARSDLRGTNLSGANLDEAFLVDADLTEAAMGGAHLHNSFATAANLSIANLNNADLTGASLSDANLSGASLRLANLAGADLTDADLHDADMAEANLAGANLAGADVRGADLRGVIHDERTIVDGAVTDSDTLGRWW